MGVKVNYSGWKNVAVVPKYSTNGGTTWILAKKVVFQDPLTGIWMRGVASDLPPDEATNITATYSATIPYTTTISFTPPADPDNDMASLRVFRYRNGALIGQETVPWSSLGTNGALRTTTFTESEPVGYDQMSYRLTTVDAEGQESPESVSPTYRFPPANPTNVTVTPFWNGTKYVARVSWGHAPGTVASYEVAWSRTSAPTSSGTLTTAYPDTDLDVTTADDATASYTFTVKAVNAAGTKSPGVAATHVMPPNPPTTLSIANVGTNTATLSWAHPTVGSRTGYRIRITNDGVNYGTWISLASSVTSYATSIVGKDKIGFQIQTLNTASSQDESQTATSSTSNVMPAPPTGQSASISNGNSVSTAWSATGSNVDSYTVRWAWNNSSTTNYTQTGITTTSARHDSEGFTPGTTQRIRVYSVYKGRESTTYTEINLVTPQAISFTGKRMLNRRIYATWSVSAPNTNTGYYVWAGYANAVAIAGTSYHAPVEATPSDWTAYSMGVQPYNSWGTGRYVNTGNMIRIPSPLVVNPNTADTYRAGAWRGIASAYQGASVSGVSQGAYFYGTQFYDYLNAGKIGYDVSVSEAQFHFWRLSGGIGAAIPIKMHLHTHTAEGGSAPTLGHGPVTMTGQPQGSGSIINLSAHGALGLIDQLKGGTWRGLAFYSTDTTLREWLGYVSESYMQLAPANEVHGSVTAGRVVIYHDG